MYKRGGRRLKNFIPIEVNSVHVIGNPKYKICILTLILKGSSLKLHTGVILFLNINYTFDYQYIIYVIHYNNFQTSHVEIRN